ncbi:MAG: hypothetical protein WCO25_05060 [Candidatus Uhrbacteria bacterium]
MNDHTFVSCGKTDAWWQLVLFHEAVHVRQYQEGRSDPRTLDLTRPPRDDREARRFAEQKWCAEMEAHQEEVAFARQIGAEKLLGPLATCATERAFDLALLGHLAHFETHPAVRAYFEKRLRWLRRSLPD